MHRLSSLPWPGPDENPVIDAMLADPDSPHWSSCYELVEKLVSQWAGDLSIDDKSEVIQNVMLKVVQYLPTFKRESKLSTWLVAIVRSCKADEFRKRPSIYSIQIVSLDVSSYKDVDDGGNQDPAAPMTIEEEFLAEEELDEINEALLKYLAEHRKRERNSNILDLYLEGYSQQEIAKELSVPAPVVGYVIRSMRRYARENRKRHPPSPSSPR